MSDSLYRSELTGEDLEQSLSTLTGKLAALKEDLGEEERAVFDEIINSAAGHLSNLQHDANVEEKLAYVKPISAAATSKIRSEILALPKALNIR